MDGGGTNALFGSPIQHIAVDKYGVKFATDMWNCVIRRIDALGTTACSALFEFMQ